MEQTTIAYWKLIDSVCAKPHPDFSSLFLDKKLKDAFIKNCDSTYKECKQNNMKDNVSSLDRHKVAAILLTEALKLGIVKSKDEKHIDNASRLFIGPEKVLLICAINYLAQEANRIIARCTNPPLEKMNSFSFPDALSCKTSYDDISCRLLHQAKNNHTLSVMDLADKFFLLEYIAVKEYYKNDADSVFKVLRNSVVKSDK